MVRKLNLLIMKTTVITFFILTLGSIACKQNNSKKIESLTLSKTDSIKCEANPFVNLKKAEYAALSKKIKQYKKWSQLDLSKDDYIKTSNGTIVAFPKGCLLDEKNNIVNGKVSVEIIALNSKEDFLNSGITTVTKDGKLLVSGGTYYFNFTSDGKKLKINQENKPIALLPVKGRLDKQMKYFKGNKDHTHQDITWENVPTPINTVSINKDKFRYLLKIQKLEEKISKKISNLQYYFTWKEKIYQIFYNRNNPRRYLSLRTNGNFVHFGSDFDGTYKAKDLYEMEKWVNSQDSTGMKNQLKALKDSLVMVRETNIETLLNNNIENPEYYAVEIATMGWMNIDKFLKEELVPFQGRIAGLDKSGKEVVVHMLATKELIHQKTLTNNGTFTFNFPVNKPFEIVIESENKLVRKKFDGKNDNLGEILI